MKKILILGTGNAQRDFIEHCKGKGFYVIVTSNVAGNLAQRLADEFYQTDITDVDGTRAIAARLKVDYVYSIGSDVAMPTVAKVSYDLSLPCFIDYETALICNHKGMLRQILLDKKIQGNIPFEVLDNANQSISIEFPAIMKPSDSQGQRGVRRVDSHEEVKRHFAKTIEFSREKKVILESYIDGDEISANAFLVDGEVHFLLISDRKVWDEYPGGIIHEHILPSKYEKKSGIAERIVALVTNVLKAIGLKNGPAYFQIKISNDGHPYLIEVTPRLDGCHMWRLIYCSTGINLLKATLDLLEGHGYTQSATYVTKPYSLEFMCAKPGTIFHRTDFNVPDYKFLQWYYEDSQSVNRMNGYFEKCGYVIKKGN